MKKIKPAKSVYKGKPKGKPAKVAARKKSRGVNVASLHQPPDMSNV